jgi:iron complex outermembrane receptor protein
MNRSTLPRAVAWAAATLCATLASAQAPSTPSTAPSTANAAVDAPADLPEVRITGSALRRIDAETAVPVITVRRAEIERSGARTTAELLQQLPVMQGGIPVTAAVGNDSRGYTSVGIHDLSDSYTLVLLNGQRVAPFAGQAASGGLQGVDLNTIPLAMVERIEVLTEGASALYGADALGGVINIITRRDGDANEATVGWTLPKGGAREWRASAFKSVGSLDETGQNLSLSASAMHRSSTPATARGYASQSQIDFEQGGKRYRFQDGQLTSAPANADGVQSLLLLNGGTCPPGQYTATDANGSTCLYNYAADLDLIPEQTQHSAMASYTRQIGPDGKLAIDALLARSQVSVHQSAAATVLTVNDGTDVFANNLAPVGYPFSSALAYTRFVDLGRRSFTDTSTLGDLALRLEGRTAGWAWQSGLKYSQSTFVSDIGNALSYGAAQSLIDNNTGYDPFLLPGQQSAAGLAALKRAAYNGEWTHGRSTLQEWQAQGTRELASLPGGPLKLALGANVRHERLTFQPSAFAQGLLSDPATGTVAADGNGDLRIGDYLPLNSSSSARWAWGAFSELLAPVSRTVEVGGAVRTDHDSVSGSAVTGKLSTRWRPTPELAWRASVGTGYKVPTLNQLRTAYQSNGPTADPYACSAALQARADAVGVSACQLTDPDAYYLQVVGPNAELKPERSVQANLGLRIEPLAGHSVGVDLWTIRVQDRIGFVSPATAFANPDAFPDAWTKVSYAGQSALAFVGRPMNLGTGMSSGVDLDASVRRGSALGLVDSQLRVSTILREDGREYAGGPWFSSVGDGALGAPALRWRASWRTSLVRAGWTHSLTARYQSGYTDAPAKVAMLDADGQPTGETATIRLKAPGQLLWDWQTNWQVNGSLQLTAGVVNIANTRPPLSLYAGSGVKGQMLGYDERFYDARGRMLVLDARLSF